jgi:hypothetical protein
MLLSPATCLPPPNLFPSIADDPSVAVWRLSLGCALLLGAEALLLLWRGRTLRAAALPRLGAFGCLALAIAAWIQSLTFGQFDCGVEISPEMAQHAVQVLHLNMVYQDLTVAALVVTLVLLWWGVFRLFLPPRRPRPA